LRQPQEDVPADLTLRVTFEVFDDLIGPLLQRPLDPADGLVGGDGQAAALTPRPQLQQRVLQERQGPCLTLHVLEQQVRQPRLELATDQVGRPLDGQTQLVFTHRADKLLAVREGGGQGGIGGALAVEVGPHG
jgi:hypothetical protein